MAKVDLYGSADLRFNSTDPYEGPDPRNVTVAFAFEDSIGLDAEIFVDGWRDGYITYKGDFSFDDSGNVSGTINQLDLATYDGYTASYVSGLNVSWSEFAAAGADGIEAIKELEATFFTGDDILDGSLDGGSVSMRLGDGDDFAIISSGLFNDVNGNRGEDVFEIDGGGGILRGGKDNDFFEIKGGQWDEINGNMGEDFLINYSNFVGTVRGGKGDDLLVNAGGGGYFWGDLGADTFKPYAVDSNKNPEGVGVMFIQDFQLGVDSLDLSAIGGADFVIADDGSTLISSLTTGKLVAVLEGVTYA